jgi:TetR/AcrR family transcriptional regulator
MADALARTRMRAPERREAILRAAREEFARHGFHAAGTAAIARAAGCSEAVIYRHFPSKKALLRAVLEEEVWGLAPQGEHPLRGDPAAGMPALLEARLADPDTVTAIRMVLLAISLSEDPEIGPTVLRAFATVRERLRAAVEAAQAAGRMRSDVDPELLTWIWHGLLLVAAIRRGISDDGAALEAVAAAEVLQRLLQAGR